MSFPLKSVFFTSVPNSTNHTRWHTLDDWYMSMIDFSQVHPKKCVCIFSDMLLTKTYYKCLKHNFLFLPHPNQNSLDFPCFELTSKMTSFCKKLGMNSDKPSTVFTFMPEPITKSLRKLPFTWQLLVMEQEACYRKSKLLPHRHDYSSA